MSIVLLDVNVLIALGWPEHQHHDVAHTWFGKNQARGWATCPLTQCGFVRISSHPGLSEFGTSVANAMLALKKLTENKFHQFWPDSISLQEALGPEKALIGHRQISDSYLLGLAIAHKGKLVTLDRGVAQLLKTDAERDRYIELVK